MRILPISYNSKYNYVNNKKPVFKAHPDFYRYNSTQSCYFRRGSVLLFQPKGYSEIEELFCRIFKPSENMPKKFLIAGIGNSQEPFSYISSIKGILKDKLLKDNVDLHTIDLQSKPEHNTLKLNAFCDKFDYQTFPKYAKNSFVKDNIDRWLEIEHEKRFSNPTEEYMQYYLRYRKKWAELEQKGYDLENIIKIFKDEEREKSKRWRVNNEVFDFVEKTYNNPQKSKWDSRLQDVVSEYSDNYFDVISANNILPYIADIEIPQTVKNILRVLKPNGYFITDPYEKLLHVKEIDSSGSMNKINSGIYQKKADK